jgi:two-component system OmpR family sensor kinase
VAKDICSLLRYLSEMGNSIRLRLTLWYLVVFGFLLTGFSIYVYSQLSLDLYKEFDASLVRTSRAAARYFIDGLERTDAMDSGHDTIAEFPLDNISIAIFRSGQLLMDSNTEITDVISSTQILSQLNTSGQVYLANAPSHRNRLAAISFKEGPIDYSLVLSAPLDNLLERLTRMRRIIFFGLPTTLSLVLISSYLLVRKSLEPVTRMSRQAEHISIKNLDERLPISNSRDELGQLATVFNAMLSRLETSFRVMREFVADASHELRTPLAIVHGEAEVCLAHDRSKSEYQQSLAIVRDQSKRMTRIVADMLALARADAGQQRLRIEELYLNDLVEECCADAQSLAAPKGVNITFEGVEDISFRGDDELLRRMVLNLLRNAIHYTPTGGSIVVKLEREMTVVRLVVSDSGIGISPESASRIFDRFYRVDSSRSRADGGSGLGLSIAKLAAEAHRGSIELASLLGSGSKFTVSLPLRFDRDSLP